MQENGHGGVYQCGAHTISPATRRLHRDGRKVDIEAKVFDLILLLIENRERALGKQEVIAALWGQRPITDAALSQLLHKARRALDDDGEQQSVIRTVYGRGLQWVAPVSVIDAEAPGTPETPSAVPQAPPQPAQAPPRGRHRRRAIVLGLAALLLIGALSFWIIPRGFAPPTPAPPRIALLPLHNDSGDAALDWTERGLPGLMANLLGNTRGIDVVDPLQIGRIVDYVPPKGRSEAEHMRFVTGADIVVGGDLHRMADHLYELSLQIDTGAHKSATTITLTGADPGTLGVDAVARLRHALQLDPAVPTAPAISPRDAYLAQTYARGIDLAMHGDWANAKPYFLLVAKGDPDFPSARLHLGQAQINTDQFNEGGATLQALLVQARAGKDASMVARTLLQLGNLALIQHRHDDALGDLQEAASFAARADDGDLQAAIALKTVNTAARLKRMPLAQSELQRARDLIAQHGLHRMDGDLYNSEAFLAEARGDLAGKEKADRAALAASEAIGNQHNALGDTYNIALDLMQQDRATEALPLFASLYRRSQQQGDSWLAFASGDQQARILLDAGLAERVAPMARQLRELGIQQHNAVWQALALMLSAGQTWYDGNAAAALDYCRQAAALVDGQQDPALLLAIRESQAAAALQADPASVAALARQADALIATQKKPATFGYIQQLIHAVAAAAAGRSADAAKALKTAAATPTADDPQHNDLRYIGLAVALHLHAPAAAEIALAGYDPAHDNHADNLRLYRQWSTERNDTAGQARAAARIEQLRSTTLAALAAPIH
ncbi:MAG: winged helix-turn-helix domain-containing protein [Rhodanobacter sp.]